MKEIPVKVNDDYICHYGRKGMKWYQHIYGKANKTKKPSEKNTDGLRYDSRYRRL